MTKITVQFLALVAAGGLLGGCGDDDNDPATRTLSLSLAGLEPLGGGYVYEGWLIVGGSPVSAGRFSIDGSGLPVPATFTVSEADAAAATKYVLTIEPGTGDDPAPSATKVLGGTFGATGEATLSTSDSDALSTDFASAAGTFFLATPTSAATDDETQGIWWITPGTPNAPGLTLPTLPAGWVYEGWVVGAAGPVSTGTFSDVAAADSDGGGPAAGTDSPAPPFPGQDFVDPATDLSSGYMAVISVEPSPDDSDAPFAIKPLGGSIGSDVAPTTQMVNNNAASTLPSGTAAL